MGACCFARKCSRHYPIGTRFIAASSNANMAGEQGAAPARAAGRVRGARAIANHWRAHSQTRTHKHDCLFLSVSWKMSNERFLLTSVALSYEHPVFDTSSAEVNALLG